MIININLGVIFLLIWSLLAFYLTWYIYNYTYAKIVGEDLQYLVDKGIITGITSSDDIQETSIDVRLNNIIHYEVMSMPNTARVNLIHKESIITQAYDLNKQPYAIPPGGFVLAYIEPIIDLPSNMSAYFYLKSDVARNGLQHSIAIKIKPGWKGRLKLELTNTTQYNQLVISDGMLIGSIEFFKHRKVKPYSGKYQNQNLN